MWSGLGCIAAAAFAMSFDLSLCSGGRRGYVRALKLLSHWNKILTAQFKILKRNEWMIHQWMVTWACQYTERKFHLGQVGSDLWLGAVAHMPTPSPSGQVGVSVLFSSSIMLYTSRTIDPQQIL